MESNWVGAITVEFIVVIYWENTKKNKNQYKAGKNVETEIEIYISNAIHVNNNNIKEEKKNFFWLLLLR